MAEPTARHHVLFEEGLTEVRLPQDLHRGTEFLFSLLGGEGIGQGILGKFTCPSSTGEHTIEQRVRPHLAKSTHIVMMYLAKHTQGLTLARTHASLQTHVVKCEQIAKALVGAILQRGKAGTLQEAKDSTHELTRRNLYAAFVALGELTGYTGHQMPFLRDIEETNMLHEASESLVQVKAARETLKLSVQGQILHRTTELARAITHDVLHGYDW